MRSSALANVVASIMIVNSAARVIPAQTPMRLQVDVTASRHAIDPNIYGIVSYGLDATFAAEIKVPNVRWGGDGTSRYNWQVDSSNSGFDWYFMGGSGSSSPTPSGSADAMIRTYKAAGAQSLITIPILPYVNKSAAWTCSFPISVYGPQQSVNPYVHPSGDNCGNSLTSAGDQLTDTNIGSNHIENSTALQMGWVQHLNATFGAAKEGGVRYYQLDNEPGGWSNTHRDVQPNHMPYPQVAALGEQYAAAVKAVDPGALVLGPSDFTLGGWIGTTTEQSGQFAGQYYLQQMAAAGTAGHRRLLDYFDEHYYFQFANADQQLASTRTLWDTTYNGGTWVEQYVFQGPMQLIPRFKQWIKQAYPGTKLAFSEYSIDSGNKAVTDAVAEADVLGIFGRQGVDFANMWNAPQPTDPIAYAFRLYRNYDGAGAQFGETGVKATSADQTQLSMYAAQRGVDGVVTVVVLNKTAAAITSTLTVSHLGSSLQASAFQYSGADPKHLVALPATAFTGQTAQVQFPAYSATVFAVRASVPLTSSH